MKRYLAILLILTFAATHPVAAQLPNGRRLLIPIKVDSLWGFCDTAENMIIPARFSHVSPFTDGLAAFTQRTPAGYRSGLIDTAGRTVLPAEYDFVSPDDLGYVNLEKDSIPMRRLPSGRIFAPKGYRIDTRFSPGLYIANDQHRHLGVIDTNQRVVVPFHFRSIGSLDDKGYARAEDMKGRSGFIDRTGKFIFSFPQKSKLRIWSEFYNDRAILAKQIEQDIYLKGFIDRRGNIVIPVIYEDVQQFSEGFCGAKGEQGWGFLNTRGDTILPLIYSGTGPFRYGRGSFSKGASGGLIDTTGKQIFYYWEGNLEVLDSNLVRVEKEDVDLTHHGFGNPPTYGLIDINGHEILPPLYQLIGNPANGLFRIYEKYDRYFYMDMRHHAYRPK